MSSSAATGCIVICMLIRAGTRFQGLDTRRNLEIIASTDNPVKSIVFKSFCFSPVPSNWLPEP
jgi:hypothetical protein